MESPRGLANELLRLIAEEAGPQVLKQALPASKFMYEVFMPFVYESPPPSALHTLALSDNDREPLRQSHPAAFVKKLYISGKNCSNARYYSAVQLKAMLDKVFQNIEHHSPGRHLQSFSVTCFNYLLSVVLTPCVGDCLLGLKELKLALSYPTMCTTTSLSY